MECVEKEYHDNSVVGVKMLNIEAGRWAHGAFPGNYPAAHEQATPSLIPRHTKKYNTHILFRTLSRLISTFLYDKAPIMTFHLK